jgi:putative ABC transport system permease protein
MILEGYVKLHGVLKAAFKALRRNKVRSLLTSIGIIIGVSSVIIMTGLANSARFAVKQKIVSYGTNAMSIGWSQKPIRERNYLEIKELSSAIQYISPYCDLDDKKIRYDRITDMVKLIGVNNDFFYMRDWHMMVGRYFDDTEIRGSLNVAIIGTSVQKTFFGGYNSVGNLLYINDTPYQVIGILEETGTNLSGKDIDKIIMIPYSTAFTRFVGKREMSGIHLSTMDESMIDPVTLAVTKYLRTAHSLQPEQKDDFDIVTSKDKMKVANSITGVLTYLMAGVASISLIVGGIGIMNIMLVSVTERTREIGIRRAIGAKKRDIMLQFLSEAVALSLIGGLIGIALGIAVYYIILTVLVWPFILSMSSMVISFLFAAGTGIFFGFYPAKKASELRPIDALRYE